MSITRELARFAANLTFDDLPEEVVARVKLNTLNIIGKAFAGYKVSLAVPYINLAKAMGGKVDYHPEGIEIGTTEIECMRTGFLDPLFKGLPEKFDVHVCHSQSVVRLPRDAVLIAGNAFEPHHAFKIGAFAWGVQFHPEYNETIMKAYIAHMEPEVTSAGKTLQDAIDRVKPTPVGAKILKRFGRLVS